MDSALSPRDWAPPFLSLLAPASPQALAVSSVSRLGGWDKDDQQQPCCPPLTTCSVPDAVLQGQGHDLT